MSQILADDETKQQRFEYLDTRQRPAVCGVQIYRYKVHTVVVVTDLQEGGTTVTRAWPQLAELICSRLYLGGVIIWLEHYPKRHNGKLPETWDVVYQGRTPHDVNWRQISSNEAHGIINLGRMPEIYNRAC